ncbi:hypothetical protein BU24DRAFT_481391 [Aaosphaeria arxii CBS 175.79]|uniref:BTB domain-containing protein n=1 Tax=Aaosphaeria arxii CBS 175.79 TaxID=1450172 RepID=A0A6A5XTV4_9PLEO|nr:uncharacterized protein BU24DRAFT_481391 [Aaosphaeria arxii CBS 175.79]KAF2016785.1 hypothetical protein BU24DRAFT_481391 [Aaosphaeria arxii CBS 175.79]
MPFMKMGTSTLGHTFRNFDQTILTVKVGGGEFTESFSCHKELLRRCSGYFDRHFQQQGSSPYKTTEAGLELEDTSPDVFDAFMLWLYTGYIPHHLIEGGKEVYPPSHSVNLSSANGSSASDNKEEAEDVDTASWGISLDNDETPADGQNGTGTPSVPDSTAEKVPGEGDGEKPVSSPPLRSTTEKPDLPKETVCPCCARPYKWRSLEGFLERRFIALYTFGHRYEIPKLRRAVMLAWQNNDEILQTMPDHSNVISAYEGLPPSSPLCRYFLDMYSVYWNPDKDDERMVALRSQLPQAFLFELATILAKGERPKIEKDWCEFHEHEDEVDRKACQEEMMKDSVSSRAIKRHKDSKSWKGLVLKKGKR